MSNVIPDEDFIEYFDKVILYKFSISEEEYNEKVINDPRYLKSLHFKLAELIKNLYAQNKKIFDKIINFEKLIRDEETDKYDLMNISAFFNNSSLKINRLLLDMGFEGSLFLEK